MKINICLILCFMLKVINTFIHEGQISLNSLNNYIFPRFEQSRLETAFHDKIEATKPYNYKLTVNVVKDSDESDDKIKNIKVVINLTKDGINVMKKKEVKKIIPFIE
jgi:hypothetical protein